MSKRLFILAFCYLVLNEVDAGIYVSKTKEFPNRNIFIDSNGINKTSLFYTVCPANKKNAEIKCQIKRLSNNQIPEKSCHVLVNYQDPTYQIFMHATVTNLNGNKNLFLWSGTNKKMSISFTKYSIVDFDNCQVINHLSRFDQELMNISVLVHENSYDLIISNSKLCNDKLCKFSFDFNGDEIPATNPSLHMFKAKAHFPPKIHSVPNGIVMARYNMDRAQVSLINSDGAKILRKYKIDNLLPFGWVPTFSIDHETIRMCTWSNTELSCHWFDYNGKPIMKNNMNAGFFILYLVVQNLSNGGYILMIAGCSDVDNLFKCRGEKQYYDLIKFNADGTTVGWVAISELKCLGENQKLEVQLFENRTKQSCISFACVTKNKSPSIASLKFTSKCFSNHEFVTN